MKVSGIFKGMAGIIAFLIVALIWTSVLYRSSNNTIDCLHTEIDGYTQYIDQLEEYNDQLKQSNLELYKSNIELEKARADEHPQFEYVGEFVCTAYCVEKYKHICGMGTGMTASGQPVQAGVSVAVGDTHKLPYGTVIYIEGIGIRIVQDTGGGLQSNQIDLAMKTHADALAWGRQSGFKVYIIKVGGTDEN